MSIYVNSCKTTVCLFNPKLFNYVILRSIRGKVPNTRVEAVDKDGFRILQLYPKIDEQSSYLKGKEAQEAEQRLMEEIKSKSRSLKMRADQDWISVWPGPRTFHPHTVPLPIRQGFPKPGEPPSGKIANTELMKIPNFLHLTPPAIKKHCEAIKKFCTKWPEGLETDKDCIEHFPLNVISSDYCYSGPSIRDPLARTITFQLKLSSLNLDSHAKDKILRLLGNRYDPKTDYITISTDRCPMRKQNYEYAEFLLTAVYHESWRKEDWEDEKSVEDMEYYDWEQNQSKRNLLALYAWPEKPQNDDYQHIPHVEEYKKAVTKLVNEGEDQNSINEYKEVVKKIMFFNRENSSPVES